MRVCVFAKTEYNANSYNVYVLLYKFNTNNFIFTKITTPINFENVSTFIFYLNFKNKLFLISTSIWSVLCFGGGGVVIVVCGFPYFDLASKKVKVLILILEVWEHHF